MSEIVVAKGGKATFSCELPDDSYTGKWMQNGSPLLHDGTRINISHTGTEHTLVILKTEKSDEGQIVFKTNKGNVEVPFQLKVTEPPAINSVEFEQAAQTLNELRTGAPMVLRIPFSGASGIKATWRFNGVIISSSGRRTIVTTTSDTCLTVDNFQEEDCGTYEVLLENAYGNIRVPVEVSLSDVSKVDFRTVTIPGETVKKSTTMTIQSDTVIEIPSKPAGNIKFDKMSSNNFTIGFITTSKGGDVDTYIVEKSSGNNVWEKCASFKPGEKTVTVAGLEAGKRYTFRIKAANSAGESDGLESRAVTVQKPSNPPVLDAAVVEKMSAPQNLKSGKDFRLKIPYKGFPLPIAQWSKDGKKLAAKGRIISETSDVDTSFAITGLSAADTGEYTLVLKNKEGNATATVKIEIIDVPSPPLGPIEMTDVMSTEMTISWKPPASTGGCPLEGYIIERKDTKSPGWSQVGKVGPDVLTFTSTGLTKGLKYSFRVKACNSEGESKPVLSALTLASGPPGPPGAPAPTKASSTSISIAWKEPENDGGSSVTAYSLEMRQDKGEWSPVSSSHIKNLTAQMENLTPESDYEFRVCAKNSTGKGRWSESPKPITAMDSPEPPVISESVKEAFAEPVTCKAGDDLLLKVPVSGIPKPTATWSCNTKPIPEDDKRFTNNAEKGAVTLKIEKAKRGDSGKYDVVIKNSEGEAKATLKVNVTDVPSAPAGPMKVLKASSKAITVGWSPPADDGGSHVTQYVVERQTCGIKDDEWHRVNKVFPGEELSVTSDQVTKGTTYKFRVHATNNLGNSPFLSSAEVVADDKYKPPAACVAPKVSDVNKTSCLLTWDEPDDGGSPIHGYLVEMKKVGRRNWIPQNSGRTVVDRSMKIKDLAQDNEYCFRVTAENEGGSGPPGKESEVITAKDPIPPPPPPEDLEIVDKTDRSISFCWKSPSDMNMQLFSGYYIEKCPIGSDEWTKCNSVPIRAPKFTVTGLNTGDRYRFRVRPYNDGGYGSACTFDEDIEIRQWHEKPKIAFDSAQSQTIAVQASGTLRLVAAITGKPIPVIRWEKDGVNLEKRGIILTQDGVTQLTIRNLAKSDSGTYVLNADNPSGNIRKVVQVIVKDAPDPPCNIKLGELQEDGSLKITWDPPKNDGGNAIKYYCLQKRDAYSRSFQTVKDKIPNTHYIVRDLKPGCTYYFRIIAENELGRGDGNQSNLLTVVQKRGPLNIEKVKYEKMSFNKSANFNLALKPIQVKERSNAKFTCAAIGKPDPEISWYKDGVRIKPNNKYSVRNHYGVCTLTVFDCRPRDSGLYKCEAINPTGRAQSEASLTVQPM